MKTALLGDVADINWGDTSVTKKSYMQEGFLAYSAAGPDGKLSYFDYDREAIILSAIGARCGKTWFAEGKWSSIKNTIHFWSEAEDLDDRYLYWLTADPSFWPKRGAAQPFITIGDARKIQISYPPIIEQKRIAAILDQADHLRHLRQQALDKLSTLSQSIFHEMFGDALGKGGRWEVKPLKELTTLITSGSTPAGGKKVYVKEGTVFFRSQNVWRRQIELDDVVYIDAATHQKMKKSSLKRGDILVTKTGRINTENSSLGRAAMFAGEDESANINGHVYLVRPRPQVHGRFILYVMTTLEYREYIRSVCVGGIDKRQINKEHLEEFPIIDPPTKVQESFLNAMSEVELQKERSVEQMVLAENLFSSLQQSAFRGEL